MYVKNGLTQKAYECIKEKIITCELMPEQDISKGDIITEMGMSRTPIREALIRLEQEKLVNIFPRKGVFVSSISLGVINDIYQAREIIEPQIINMVGSTLSKEWLKDLRDRISAKADKTQIPWYYVNLDKDFHSKIIETCNNSYLIQLMNNIFDQNQRLRILSVTKTSDRLNQSNKEHLDIIESLLEGDIDNAQLCMKRHIVNARNTALNLSLSQ